MTETITTLDVRKHLGDILDRVALRRDQFIIERKGKPLAAVVSVDKLEQLDRAARDHILGLLSRPRASLSQAESDRLANEAKHASRSATRRRRSR